MLIQWSRWSPLLLGGSCGGLRVLQSFPWHALFSLGLQGKEDPHLAGDSLGSGMAGISPQWLFGGCFP